MSGQGQFRSRLLRHALITAIAVGGAGACQVSLSKADMRTCLIEAVERLNVMTEAAATEAVRLLVECKLDLASF